MSKVYTVASASLGHTAVVPSLDCYTVATEFASWMRGISSNRVFSANGCAEDSAGVLTGFSLEEYRTTGAYVGSVPSGVLTVASYTGVEPNLPVDPVDVVAVFAGVFVPMVSLYLVGYAIRKVLNLIEGKR